MAALFLVGDGVRVRACDDYYAFIDGWFGIVQGCRAGMMVIHCDGDQGQTLEFLVPADQLEATSRAK